MGGCPAQDIQPVHQKSGVSSSDWVHSRRQTRSNAVTNFVVKGDADVARRRLSPGGQVVVPIASWLVLAT